MAIKTQDELSAFLSQNIKSILKGAFKASLKNPAEALFLFRYLKKNKRQQKKRAAYYAARGVSVPPFLICSITRRCNLHCRGCYAWANGICSAKPDSELSAQQWSSIFSQAGEAGVSFALLAGGEPLLRADILQAAAQNESMLFPVFTNGTLIEGDNLDFFRAHRNMIPVLSIEGGQKRTDSRRGPGMYGVLTAVMKLLCEQKILFGVSVTVTTNNFGEVMSAEFLEMLERCGCRLVFYVEYVPVAKNTHILAPDAEIRRRMDERLSALRREFPALTFLAFPGDEKYMGGCLAAGRGFFHIDASGSAQACPFSPYGDMNLTNASFDEVLKSEFFSKLRQSHVTELSHEGGCALFNNQSAVLSCLSQPAREAISAEDMAGEQDSELKTQNIIDYVRLYGGDSFDERPFCELDSLVFDTLSYLHLDMRVYPMKEHEKKVTLKSLTACDNIADMLTAVGDKKNMIKLLTAAAQSVRFRYTLLGCYESKFDISRQRQFAAVTFMPEDESAYIAYRGTDNTVIGWKEDFNMMHTFPVPAQQDALFYLCSIAMLHRGTLRLGGHSKGGNLAIYAAAYCGAEIQERILSVHCHDGPGFKKSVQDELSYQRIAPRINKIVPVSSMIGLILEKSENYKVVCCDKQGYAQHNCFNWETAGIDFAYMPQLAAASLKMHQSLSHWLDSMSDAQRREFVELLFKVINPENAVLFDDVNQDIVQTVRQTGVALKDADPQMRKIVLRACLLFARVFFDIKKSGVRGRNNG